MNTPDDAALLARARNELGSLLEQLQHPERGTPVITMALAAARLMEDIACGEAALGDGDPESLAQAASLYKLALVTLLSREDRRDARYVLNGTLVNTPVERPRDGIGFEPIADGILCCWAADRFDTAATIGSLPTQLYRPEGKKAPDAVMYWTFALASAARGNDAAFDRAVEHLRESADSAEPDVRTWAAGYALPGAAALEAILSGRQRVAERQLAKMLRYHRWKFRKGGLRRGLDISTSGLTRFARSQGLTLTIADALLLPLPDEPDFHDSMF